MSQGRPSLSSVSQWRPCWQLPLLLLGSLTAPGRVGGLTAVQITAAIGHLGHRIATCQTWKPKGARTMSLLAQVPKEVRMRLPVPDSVAVLSITALSSESMSHTMRWPVPFGSCGQPLAPEPPMRLSSITRISPMWHRTVWWPTSCTSV
jgi:hypothetical protein